MYCPNCGKEVEAGDRFCKYCSFNLGDQPGSPGEKVYTNAVKDDPRSTGLAMALSVILPGLGAYYIDGNTTGLVIFLLSLVIAVVTGVMPFLLIISFVVLLVLWLVGLKVTSDSIDSYRQKYPL